VIDLDWLGWVHPTALGWTGERTDALISANLAVLAGNYAAAGLEHLILARLLVRDAALAAVRRALPGIELKVVRLNAAAATLEARLRRRDSGRELEEHLGEFASYADLAVSVPVDGEVENDGRSLTEVAEEVLSLAGW